MKNLKLTNLEKMPQKEMEEVKGGGLPWIGFHKGMKGRCACATWCSQVGIRANEGHDAATNNYTSHHYHV